MPNLSSFFYIEPTAAACANQNPALRSYFKFLGIFDMLLTIHALKDKDYSSALLYGCTCVLLTLQNCAMETLSQECAATGAEIKGLDSF